MILLALAVLVLVAIGATVAVLEIRYPMGDVPVEKFNSIIPVLVGSAECAFLGFIMYRDNSASAHLRTHGYGHWEICKAKGRYRHLWDFLRDFVAGLFRYGFRTVWVDSRQRRYLMAYWLHPEEVIVRNWAADPKNAKRALAVP